ncbi:DUF397 domain-containing protein [Salinispora oceanensis]|uniref:DUF397 domain-containing protein n=1 Tax=Salinispora oceanensis TaxID=1050199 RepID=UPI000376F114|nr:DUF397 domain-containing protein [Salinispora oceanensis]
MTPTIGPQLPRAHWRTSSHSGDEGACVEIATLPQAVGVRDSKDRSGPTLLFTPAAWTTFAAAPPRR